MAQKGFTIILIILIGAALVLASLFFLSNSQSPKTIIGNTQKSGPISGSNGSDPGKDSPPLKLRNIGVNIDYYDPTTEHAGDFVFTKKKLEFGRLFMGFGFVIPSNTSSSGQDKSNPQPTFVVPLGTQVLAIVDGIVAATPTLWSGDYSIQITTDGKMQKWVYEMEHVINPKVKVGDKVSAGQPVGEVSNFNRGSPEGFGAVEIGILKGGNPPEHVCPFAYLDEGIKVETFKKIDALFKSWEEYTGDQELYNDTSIPGCLTLDPIKG